MIKTIIVQIIIIIIIIFYLFIYLFIYFFGVKCGTSLRFWENKGLINEIENDERQINKWKKIVSRFRGKLVKMIKNAGSKFDDYLISPKIRQILLHWGYELTEKVFLLTWQTNV